jgi:serine protease AprX
MLVAVNGIATTVRSLIHKCSSAEQALDSNLAGIDERALTANRLLSIEGTSMSAPVVTGALALMLQKKKKMTQAQAIAALSSSAVSDGHTSSVWNPAYGHGKLNIAGAISQL